MNCSPPTLLLIIATTLIGCGPGAETLRTLDPSNSDNWSFKEVTETSGATSYIFDGDVKPPLQVDSDNNAYLTSTTDVNAALKKIGLPTVAETRPDKGYAENERIWRGQYHWDDYPLGKLVISRTSARDKRNYDDYDAIWKTTIDKTESSDK